MRRSSEIDLLFGAMEPGESLQAWVCRSLRKSILSGELRPHTRLPPSRSLAQRYEISRGTVLQAIDQLLGEGYLYTRQGSGTYVSPKLQTRNNGTGVAASAAPQRAALPTSRRGEPLLRRAFKYTGGARKASLIAFRPNMPALDRFPRDIWARMSTRVAKSGDLALLADGDTFGYLPLRDAIAAHISATRAVSCSAEQIAIFTSTQQALDLTLRLITDEGDDVCVEDPCYPGALRLLEAAGLHVHPLPVSSEGLDIQRMAASVRPRVIYTTPSHQYPTGVPMSLPRRVELLRWAADSDALVFEDDYDGEYRHVGRPLPALQGMDDRGSVIYAGGFSKTLFPALRISYLVIPEQLVDRYATALALTARYTSVMPQAVLTLFLQEGHFGRHLLAMRKLYGERKQCLLGLADTYLGGGLDLVPSEVGLNIFGWLRDGADAAAACAAAGEQGVEAWPATFASDSDAASGILLGFAAFNEDQMRRGVQGLARALERTRVRLR